MLSLSEATAQSTSVAAIGVAAHECGHAVQDHRTMCLYVFVQLLFQLPTSVQPFPFH